MAMGQTFGKTFKLEAVRLVHTSGKSMRQLAEDLGVSLSRAQPLVPGCRQNLLADERIQTGTRQMLAPRFSVVRPALDTFIGVQMTATLVMGGESAIATSTDHQTSEHRRSVACCTHRIGTRAVGLQPRLVVLTLPRRNASWAAIGEENQPLLPPGNITHSARNPTAGLERFR